MATIELIPKTRDILSHLSLGKHYKANMYMLCLNISMLPSTTCNIYIIQHNETTLKSYSNIGSLSDNALKKSK